MTTVNLRKATALIARIEENLQEVLRVPCQSVVDIHTHKSQSVADTVALAQKKFDDAVAMIDVYYRILLNLRTAVGQANAASGVSERLTKIAIIDRKIRTLNTWANNQPTVEIDYLNSRLNTLSTAYGTPGVVDYVQYTTSSAKTLEQIKQTIKDLKKEKQQLNDEILELNIKTTISLDQQDVESLTQAGIL